MTTTLPPLPRRHRRAIRSWLWRYRPALVAALAALAAWSAIGAVRPAPAPTTSVVAPTSDLPAGHVLAAGDVALLDLPSDVAPTAAVVAPADLVGRRIAHPVADGVPLVPDDLVESGAWEAAEPGELVVPVRLADPAVAALLPIATPIHLVSATGSGPTLLTTRARLVARVDESSGGSMLGGSEQTETLLLLAVPAEVATLVLDAGAGGTLTIAVGGGG